jgi:hypothetical protein
MPAPKKTREEREEELAAMMRAGMANEVYAIYARAYGSMPAIGSLMSHTIQAILDHEYPPKD